MDHSFEEAYCLDVEGLSANIEAVTLKEGDSFDNFAQAKKYIKFYSEFKGFKIRMGRSTAIKTTGREKMQRKRTIYCHHFGQYHMAKPGATAVKQENQNACIKRIVESSNTSLCELGKVLIDISEDKVGQTKYQDQIKNISLTVNVAMIFPTIEMLVKRYLQPNVTWKLHEEAIAENDHFGLRFTSVENSGMQISHVTKRFEWLHSFIYISEENNVNGDNNFIEKQLFYGKVWGLVCTATDKCLLYNDTEFVSMIENYLANMHEKEAQQTSQKSDLNDSDKENNFSDFQLRNPLKVSTRGRPKLASYCNNSKRNLQPIHDESATKQRRQNQCSYCKKVGHNIATYTKKDIDDE
ncbi:hypothetical protein C2G38_2036714 [Gigaspora rosea]|uniref:FAR1 domain-containing protein n=1 Tax=Gigaspora rosea TaxID=44941 RepID=A0A397VCI3_9GLOM|nr:hypothetical protein C2G38_2036714 [Gigaspora rosea]